MTLIGVGIGVGIGLVPACGQKNVTRDECALLLDRYVDQQARRDDPKATSMAIERAQQEARRRATRSTGYTTCPGQVTREQYECAMHAWDPDAIERCLVPIP